VAAVLTAEPLASSASNVAIENLNISPLAPSVKDPTVSAVASDMVTVSTPAPRSITSALFVPVMAEPPLIAVICAPKEPVTPETSHSQILF
jgi:hypothetical protein